MRKRKAIITLAIGMGYRYHWNNFCRANWLSYADRHGYDLVCVDAPLDDSERARSRSPAWQKCLILSQEFSKRYERIVWLDSDILIHPRAPSVVMDVPIDKVGAVDEYSSPTPGLHRQALSKLCSFWKSKGVSFIRNETAEEFYKIYGLSSSFDRVVQTGVLVLSPDHHRQILEDVYFSYEDKGDPNWNYEMRPLSYELLKANCVHWLDHRFNLLWAFYKCLYHPSLLDDPSHGKVEECSREAFTKSYFLHFAGYPDEMPLVDLDVPQKTSPPPVKGNQFKIPIVLILFNRPDTTERVFKAIRQARPTRLLVVADGPREDWPEDAKRCSEARAVVESVDWECQVLKDYSDVNLGLKNRVESGLSWVFDQVEEAIILEDDCLPHPTFFRFCEELLEHYRDNSRVIAISGSNFQLGQGPMENSYYFSRYPLIWGWATWRRAWRMHDPNMTKWPEIRGNNELIDILQTPQAIQYWSYIFQTNYENLDTWDYAWVFSCWVHQALSIHPGVNLVSNIGFRFDATHTKVLNPQFANLPVEPMSFPLRHPAKMARDEQADALIEETMFSGKIRHLFDLIRARRKTSQQLLRNPVFPERK